MASRGHLGGLSWATPQALRVLDAAGCDVILVETVGVGQSEVEIAGAGRHHAGADRARHGRRHPGGEGRHPRDRRPLRRQQGRPRRRRPGAPRAALDARARRPARGRLAAADREDVASKGEGIDEVVAAIEKHRAWLESSGELDPETSIRATTPSTSTRPARRTATRRRAIRPSTASSPVPSTTNWR